MINMTDKLIMTRIVYEMKDAQQNMINGNNKKQCYEETARIYGQRNI